MAKLVLVRHGQSLWNLEDRFTGWVDVPLTDKGRDEARNAGKRLKDVRFDVAYTSVLSRAQETLDLILGKNVLAVAHGNSNRSIVMKLDRLSKEQVVALELATGVPLVYEVDGR